MGITEVVTFIFITLKLCGLITWSWWLVLLPEIAAIGLIILLAAFFGLAFVDQLSLFLSKSIRKKK